MAWPITPCSELEGSPMAGASAEKGRRKGDGTGEGGRNPVPGFSVSGARVGDLSQGPWKPLR